ncbi:hypothetical protein HAX54_011498 [Datura stramonium]|uniref:Uncharacterized protein n=1 Tax=Datura stramonium TaxID=4076 RepID=A0ABS8TK18_DATST|nr:hypothetical protein [Datura stramonium]
MSQKVRGCMLGFDVPFNPLRVKGAHGRGRKERKTDLENDSNGLGGDGAGLAVMQELLGGFPRLPQGANPLWRSTSCNSMSAVARHISLQRNSLSRTQKGIFVPLVIIDLPLPPLLYIIITTISHFIINSHVNMATSPDTN